MRLHPSVTCGVLAVLSWPVPSFAQHVCDAPPETAVTLPSPGAARLQVCQGDLTPPDGWRVIVNGQTTDVGGLSPIGAPNGAGQNLYELPLTFATAGTYTVASSSYNTAGTTLNGPAITVTVLAGQPPPASPLTETGVFTGTGLSSAAPVSVSAHAGALLLAMISGDGAAPQTTSISGCGTWTRVGTDANAQPSVAGIWSSTTGAALSGCQVTGRVVTGSKFVRATVVAIDGAAGIGAVAKASWTTGSVPAKVTLTPQAAGSFVYAAGSDYTAATARTVLSGQRKLAESPQPNAGTFWMQALNGVTANTTPIVIGTSAPNAAQWNMVAVEVRPSMSSPSCSFTVGPSSVTAPRAGSVTPLTVTASGSTCGWTATSGLSWAPVSPASGTGTGTVTATVAVNTGAARTGTITVAGQSVTVSQAADLQPTGSLTSASFSITASDDQSVTSVACLVDGATVATFTAGPYVCSVGAVSAGTHTVAARVTDSSGQTATIALGSVVR